MDGSRITSPDLSAYESRAYESLVSQVRDPRSRLHWRCIDEGYDCPEYFVIRLQAFEDEVWTDELLAQRERDAEAIRANHERQAAELRRQGRVK